MVSKLDFNVLETMTAGVTTAGVECGKKVQELDQSEQQAQFMPCVREQLQALMNQRNEAERASLMEAKGCVMGLLNKP